jgi:predicted lipid-binding transport protein (Tim44 family)/uncharacterized membrane protein YgcG
MKTILTGLLTALCLLTTTSALHARGGGGCLLQGTLVLTPAGNVPVERLKPGDPVIGVNRGSLTRAVVQALTVVQAEEYIKIIVNGRISLFVTPEHPVEISFGVFRMASALKTGDKVNIAGQRGVAQGAITAITRMSSRVLAYNLLVSPSGNYIANNIVVHNKGCFLPDTPIRRADGTEVPLSGIKRRDRVLAFNAEGKLTPAAVRKILTYDVEEYRVVRAGNMVLHVTAEHSFYVGFGTFKTLDTLKTGDTIYIYDGNGLSSQIISSITAVYEKKRVYNLQTAAPHTYLANGVAVHNKGGGGGGGSHGGGYRGGSSRSGSSHSSRGSSGESAAGFFVAFFAIGSVIVVSVILLVIIAKRTSRAGNLDYLFNPAQIARKRDKTMKLLTFISKQDPSVLPPSLQKTAETVFLKLQECWQMRDYTPMKPLLVPDLYQEHLLQIQGMVHNHEINMIAGLKIEQIDLVHIRYTLKETEREFTALITATAQDYYIDDRTKARLRGDEAPARFQEFWTFHYRDGSWLLREIEQSGESGALKEDNFIEQLTDKNTEQIYGKTAASEGPAGPWLEKESAIKETRIERMLNFLVQTDKLWDRSSMVTVARNTFIKTTVAWESGDPSKVPVEDLFPEVADDLRKEIAGIRDKSTTLEFRNLCVRKVELVLVNNYADNSRDEFVVRIRAHAQKIMKRNGAVLQKDDDVTPFEQYLTFGRLSNQWKLKEVVNTNASQNLVNRENVDEESSPQQLQWYYQHKRAI